SPGSGKSALMAALAFPSATAGAVPSNFVQAVVFLHEGLSPADIARLLGEQLTRSLGERFSDAKRAFVTSISKKELNKLPLLAREIAGPLEHFVTVEPVRIVFDALDRVSQSAERTVRDLIQSLANQKTSLRVMVTARPETVLPNEAAVISVGVAGN